MQFNIFIILPWISDILKMIEKVVALSSFEIWCIRVPISLMLYLTRKQLGFQAKHIVVFQQSSTNVSIHTSLGRALPWGMRYGHFWRNIGLFAFTCLFGLGGVSSSSSNWSGSRLLPIDLSWLTLPEFSSSLLLLSGLSSSLLSPVLLRRRCCRSARVSIYQLNM